jgi:hypothetical protein
MVKTLYTIRQMVFDLDLKVKIVKEKKTTRFSTKNKYRNNGWAVHMIFLGC